MLLLTGAQATEILFTPGNLPSLSLYLPKEPLVVFILVPNTSHSHRSPLRAGDLLS